MAKPSKLDERLAKLQTFGDSAGAKPAARALETPPPSIVPVAEPSPPAPPAPEPIPKPAVPEPVVSSPKAMKPVATRSPMIRNVAFSGQDFEHIDRLENTLLGIRSQLGIRVTLADVIRLALYTAYPTKEQAVQVMQAVREQDGRLKQNKTR